MTLVAMWLDWTNGNAPRLLCQADSRLSNTRNSASVTDRSTKLFRLPLNLYRLNDFDISTGTLRSPYFTSAVGMAYSGDPILVLDIVNILTQTLSNLAIEAEAPESPLLAWEEIITHVELVVRTVASGYRGIAQIATDIFVFGARPGEEDFRKLAAHHFSIRPTTVTARAIDLYEGDVFVIGSAHTALKNLAESRHDLRDRLRLAKRHFDQAPDDDRHEREVELWHARSALSNHYKDCFARVVAAGGTVGGAIQMIEVTSNLMVARKRAADDLFGIPGVEQIGRFTVVIVTEQ